jgi:hypothetical protein
MGSKNTPWQFSIASKRFQSETSGRKSFIGTSDRPGKRRFDLELGQAYARKAITAMEADRNTALIGLIIQDMIRCGREPVRAA